MRMNVLYKNTLLFLFILSGCFCLSGCSFYTNEPLDILRYNKHSDERQKHLFVVLRGIGGAYTDFEKYGFVDAVKESEIDFDILIPDAHFGYYAGRTLINRLQQDVITPAKLNGYDTIWMVGVSMGGLGSLLYCKEHADQIDGIYLISPFLGYKSIIREIEKSGDVESWLPGKDINEDDWQRSLWAWIKENSENDFPVPVYLASGKSDPYKRGQKLLAGALAEDHVLFIDGKHNYQTFVTLWKAFLEEYTLDHRDGMISVTE